jgi:hypothetical protein
VKSVSGIWTVFAQSASQNVESKERSEPEAGAIRAMMSSESCSEGTDVRFFKSEQFYTDGYSASGLASAQDEVARPVRACLDRCSTGYKTSQI